MNGIAVAEHERRDKRILTSQNEAQVATSSIRNDPPNPRHTDLHEHDPHDKLAARIAIVEQHVRLENAHDLEGVLSTFRESARYHDKPLREYSNALDRLRPS